MQYDQVFVSAEQAAQPYRILDALIARQLVLGRPPKFLWKCKDNGAPDTMHKPRLLIREQDNNNLITHARNNLKDERVVAAEATSFEENCMISFLPMLTNRSLRLLPDKSFHGRGEQAAFELVDAVAALTFVSTEKIYSRTKCSNAEIATRNSTSSIRPTRQEK